MFSIDEVVEISFSSLALKGYPPGTCGASADTCFEPRSEKFDDRVKEQIYKRVIQVQVESLERRSKIVSIRDSMMSPHHLRSPLDRSQVAGNEACRQHVVGKGSYE
jgi:hypothetical protein